MIKQLLKRLLKRLFRKKEVEEMVSEERQKLRAFLQNDLNGFDVRLNRFKGVNTYRNELLIKSDDIEVSEVYGGKKKRQGKKKVKDKIFSFTRGIVIYNQ